MQTYINGEYCNTDKMVIVYDDDVNTNGEFADLLYCETNNKFYQFTCNQFSGEALEYVSDPRSFLDGKTIDHETHEIVERHYAG